MCQKVLFTAIAPKFGREGLHIMTASMRLVNEGCADKGLWVGSGGRRGPPEAPCAVRSNAETGLRLY